MTLIQRLTIVVFAVVLGIAPAAGAQTPQLNPDHPQRTAVPTIHFTYAMEGATPDHYSIALDSTGKAAYSATESDTRTTTPGEPYTFKFTISPATASRIFDLAKQVNYFQGDFELHGRKLANMGAKTLSFSDSDTYHETTYNYSINPAMQQLTELFQGLGETLEYGRRLVFLHRYEPLGLDAELKSMEVEASRNRLPELQVIQPVLESIANDTAVMNISRRRAQGLLGKIQAAPGEKPASGESK